MGTLSKDEKTMQLQGYVRVTNNSGEDYENAQTRLIVGKVNILDQTRTLAQRKHAYGSPAPQEHIRWRSSGSKSRRKFKKIAESEVDVILDFEFQAEKDIKKEIVAMFKAAGFKDVQPYEEASGPGLGIHEMGGARMGHSSKTSILNKHNQVHTVKNVYVTDGAFMTSSNCVNPSLTYMAFTARAANHAAEQIKTGRFS